MGPHSAQPAHQLHIVSASQKARLAALVEQGPNPAVHDVVRWRACDLVQWIQEEFGISVSDDTVYRMLKSLGFSHVSARPGEVLGLLENLVGVHPG